MAWILFAIGQMLALAWLGPVIAAVQHIVPPNMRATASASFLFINNLIGIGLGIYILGDMSVRAEAAYGTDPLRYSILYGLGFYLLSALLYFVAGATAGEGLANNTQVAKPDRGGGICAAAPARRARRRRASNRSCPAGRSPRARPGAGC